MAAGVPCSSVVSAKGEEDERLDLEETVEEDDDVPETNDVLGEVPVELFLSFLSPLNADIILEPNPITQEPQLLPGVEVCWSCPEPKEV